MVEGEEEAEKYLIWRERRNRNWGVVYLYPLLLENMRYPGGRT